MKIEQIIDNINSITVLHTQFKAALDGLSELIEQSYRSGIPLGASVVAPSGSGKTHLIKTIERIFSKKTDLLDPSSAVIVISAPSSPTIGSIIDRILQQLGHPPGIRTTRLQDLRQNILMLALRDRGVRVLIIDEFQHIFRGNRTIVASEITDVLKEISDKTGIPILVFGTDELGDLSHIDAQFATRVPARFQIRPFSRGEEWLGFLKAFHEQCVMINLSCMSTLSRQLHAASSGSPRTLNFLVIAAVRIAIAESNEVVSKFHFFAAFSIVFGTSTQMKNPFADT